MCIRDRPCSPRGRGHRGPRYDWPLRADRGDPRGWWLALPHSRWRARFGLDVHFGLCHRDGRFGNWQPSGKWRDGRERALFRGRVRRKLLLLWDDPGCRLHGKVRSNCQGRGDQPDSGESRHPRHEPRPCRSRSQLWRERLRRNVRRPVLQARWLSGADAPLGTVRENRGRFSRPGIPSLSQSFATISSVTFHKRSPIASSWPCLEYFATLQSAKYSPLTLASEGCVAT